MYIKISPQHLEVKQMGCKESYNGGFSLAYKTKTFPYCKNNRHVWIFYGSRNNTLELPTGGQKCLCGEQKWEASETDTKYKNLLKNQAYMIDLKSIIDEIKPDDEHIPGFTNKHTDCLLAIERLNNLIVHEMERMEEMFLTRENYISPSKVIDNPT